MGQNEIYWLEEIDQEHRDLVGNKSANLGEMKKVPGIEVPPGFAISIPAYERFVREAGIGEKIRQYVRSTFPKGLTDKDLIQIQEAAAAIRSIVESHRMPQYLMDVIDSKYCTMCETSEKSVAVSVRSAGAKSHPGQYETHLNVVGLDRIIEKIIKVWSSIYNTKSITAAIRQAMPIEECPPVGVCILKMVNARAAGVCLTVHPITGDDSCALVESSFGLGESVVGGMVTPDQFIVNKIDMRVTEAVAGHKKKRVVATGQGVIEEVIPEEEKKRLSISQEEAVEIVGLAKKLESHFGIPQDIEWAIDDGLPCGRNIVLLQTRRQVNIPEKKTAGDLIADMLIKKYRSIR